MNQSQRYRHHHRYNLYVLFSIIARIFQPMMNPLNESLIEPPTCIVLSSLVPNFTFVLLPPLVPSFVQELVQVDISILPEKLEHRLF